MSARVVNGDSISFTSDTAVSAVKMIPAASSLDVEFANCECCGLMEECTLEYIERVRERFQGKWICGLCAEAVTDEIVRSGRLITADEALSRHFNFCGKFRSSLPPPDPTIHLIAALKQLLRKSFDSPKLLRSMPCSPTKSGNGDVAGVGAGLLLRSESCMPSLTLVDKADFCAMELQEDCR